MRERDIEQAVCQYARARGVQVRKLKWLDRRGAPDRVFLWRPQRILFVEFKAPGGQLRPDQVREIKTLQALGFQVEVVSSIETGKGLIDAFVG